MKGTSAITHGRQKQRTDHRSVVPLLRHLQSFPTVTNTNTNPPTNQNFGFIEPHTQKHTLTLYRHTKGNPCLLSQHYRRAQKVCPGSSCSDCNQMLFFGFINVVWFTHFLEGPDFIEWLIEMAQMWVCRYCPVDYHVLYKMWSLLFLDYCSSSLIVHLRFNRVWFQSLQTTDSHWLTIYSD